MTDLHWTETDGVATVWTDVPGPLRAELLFRTGIADETLVTRGLTHLIEHIVLGAIDDPAHHHNGFVGHTLTGFLATGDPEEVAASLLGMCRGLASLPSNRLDAEKHVLEAEDAARSNDLGSELLTWRFGAAGFGLAGLSELGVRSATIERLRDFGAQRFTRGNAVLWLTGPPPPGLRLEFAEGERQPLPPLEPLPQMFPVGSSMTRRAASLSVRSSRGPARPTSSARSSTIAFTICCAPRGPSATHPPSSTRRSMHTRRTSSCTPTLTRSAEPSSPRRSARCSWD